MAGVDNIKDVVKLFMEFVEDIAQSMEDGKIDLTDALNFFGTLQLLGPALSGINDIGKELADLDETEKKFLNAYIAQEFDLADDKVEGYIEKAIGGILMLSSLIPLFQGKKKA